MSKRDIKNIILLLIISIYSLIHMKFISRNLAEYSESVTASFTLLFTFLSIKLLGFQKSGNSKLKQTITNTIILFIAIYIVLLFIYGISKGYTSNIYFKSFESLLFNSIIIISLELFRYVMIRANSDKKYISIIITIIITIFEVLYLKNANLISIISRNILMSYLAYNVGFTPVIIFRLCMDIFKLAIPIMPSISEYTNSFLYVGASLMSYLYASRKINKYIISKDKNKKNKICDISFVAFIIVVICLVSQMFPYCVIGIGSGSMEPELHVGDAVFVHKISDSSKIREGQIIVYEVENIKVIHRVVKVVNDNNITYYKTKGDANNSIDDIKLTIDNIYGVVEFKIPFIAKPTIYLSKFLNGD